MADHLCPRSIEKRSIGHRFHPREVKEVAQRTSARLRFGFIVAAFLGALASAGFLAAQEPKTNTPKDSGIVLRQTVRRVRVDVVVTDAQGHPVKGLRASDFGVAEDGKPQSIRQFEYHSDEIVEAALLKRPPLPPHTFMNLPTVQEHGPLTILLYDMVNTPLKYQSEARAQMPEFLKKNTGRRIAIFILNNRQLRLLQGFTSDTEVLERAANDPATKFNPPSVLFNPEIAENPNSELIDDSERLVGEWLGMIEPRIDEDTSAVDRRADLTLEALAEIGRFFAEVEGRKNLIWYTGSFPANLSPIIVGQIDASQYFNVSCVFRNYSERLKAATNRLNAAEITVYSVDARGLLGCFEHCKAFTQTLAAGIGTMDVISEQTGGHAFYNTNGIDQALESAADDRNSYYSLVYAPTNAKYDGSVRRISVHLGHEHYHLAYRRSYIADDATSTAHEHSAEGRNTASSDPASSSVDSMEAESQFGAPSTHHLVFAAHVDAIGKPTSATAEQMAALEP